MLNIFYCDMPEAVYNTAVHFKNVYEEEWILEIAKKKDITINLRHLMDFGNENFAICILNTNKVVHNMEQLVLTAGMFV